MKRNGNIIEKYLSEHFEISSELKSKEIWINCEAFSSISYPEIIWKFLFQLCQREKKEFLQHFQ